VENYLSDLKKKVGEGLSSNIDAKLDAIKVINKTASELNEENHFLNYLKNKEDLKTIYSLVRNKKMSNNEIRKKIKEYLKDPDDLKQFLESILNLNKAKKKEENKEATDTASGGGYTMPFLSSGPEKTITKGDLVKTVRERKEQKIETKEATTSSSSGQYNQPAIWAKSMSKKHWKGASTKYMPGAKRVQVKKQCKKFPYCNQGDIKALRIFENESVQNAIDSVSSNYGIDKNFISKIVFEQIKKR